MTGEEKNTPAESPSKEAYVLVNAYDETVRSNVRTLMSQMDMCKCEKCFLDACALVFNNQYTHFVTTRAGMLLTKVPEMSYSKQAEMTVAILDALKIVRDNPQH